MTIATLICSVLLAALLAFAAARKLSHRPEVVRSYARVGVQEERLNLLAGVLLVGAVGLVAGLFWPPLGVAAGISVAVYFLVAIAAHIRWNDIEHLPTPLAIELLAVGTVAVRVASL
jgi:hypothetical protein